MTQVRSVLALFAVLALSLAVSACDGKQLPTQPTGPGAAPIISLFAADQVRITLGQTATLRWEVLEKDALVRIDPAPGNVGNVGNAVVTPTASITYSLLARSPNGLASQRSVTVTVVTASGLAIQ